MSYVVEVLVIYTVQAFLGLFFVGYGGYTQLDIPPYPMACKTLTGELWMLTLTDTSHI